MGSGDAVLEAVCVVFGLERALEDIASEEAELYEESRESPNLFQNDQHGPEVSQQIFSGMDYLIWGCVPPSTRLQVPNLIANWSLQRIDMVLALSGH